MNTHRKRIVEAAPDEYLGRNLVEDGCPCGCMSFEEFPAGYYTCADCLASWSGDPAEAKLLTYFGGDADAA